ncbi:RimK family alpha-L-glutamate ligase [Actinoplanes sp. NPDC051494]|uniref:RimK family alpha-L-glutamate ligase n=1 Tax=Actinoplanes sp. NPDC051494 TaxID=3363907 RepID=UPI0037B1C92D
MEQSGDGNSVVLLVNGAGGPELAGVHAELTGAMHIPSVFMTTTDGSFSFDPDSGIVRCGGVRVRPVVTWVRHFAPGTLTAHARPAGSVPALAAAAWSGLLGQVADAAVTALPGTAPAGTAQLPAAGRLGVRTPRTVLTTDVADGARRVGSARVIVKTPDFRLVEPDPRHWGPSLPVVLDRDAAAGARSPGGRPVVVQEYVPHACELRVYYVDGGICAFRVRQGDPAARWTDPAGVAVTRVDCPDAAGAVVRTLAAAWGLRYAAFDLLITGTGEVVLLEANPDGDWLFYERRAGWHGVTFMAAVMLRELFGRALRKGSDERSLRP